VKAITKKLEAKFNANPRLKLELALSLGYKTPSTIDRWLSKERIPDWQVDAIKKFLETKGK